jgi:hypothetical protein
LALTPSLGRSTLFHYNTTAGPVHAGPARGWERFQNGCTCKTCILQSIALHSAEPHGQTFHWMPPPRAQKAVNVPLTPSFGSGRLSSCIVASSVPLALDQLQTNAFNVGGPCWRVLPLGLGAASNVANLQGCAGIPSSYSSNKYPQTSTTNAQRQDKSFHSTLSSAFIVSLFTHCQLSIQVRFYINVYLGTIPPAHCIFA